MLNWNVPDYICNNLYANKVFCCFECIVTYLMRIVNVIILRIKMRTDQNIEDNLVLLTIVYSIIS